MHYLDILLDLIGEEKLIGFSLGRAEHDGLANATITDKDISKSAYSVLPGAVNGQVVNGP